MTHSKPLSRLAGLALALVLTLASPRLAAQKSSLGGHVSGLSQRHLCLLPLVDGRLGKADTLWLNSKDKFHIDLAPASATAYLIRTGLAGVNDVHLVLLPGERVTLNLELTGQRLMVTHTKGSRNAALFADFQKLAYAEPTTQADVDTLKARIASLLERNKDQLMAAFLVTIFDQEASEHLPLYESVRDALQPAYGSHPFVQHLNKILATTLGAGRPAPDIDMVDPSGNHRRLSDLRGQVVLIDFWASWCRPCRMENPNVVRLYQKYHEAGFTVFSVSLDRDRAAWLQAIEKDGLVWPNHVSDLQGWTSSGGATYGVSSIPTTFLVDRDGNIIARDLRGADLERQLRAIFGF